MPYNQINPAQTIQMIKGGQNPQQVLLNIMEQRMSSSPVGRNLINLAKNNRTAEIEQIARNIAQQKGINYDEAFNAFKKNLGL